MPGGFGTMDELFEVMTLVQTKKIERVPIVLMGKAYWMHLVEFMRTTLLKNHKYINKEDLDLFLVTDSVEEAVKYINSFYDEEHNELAPNF
jgi:uncharacterized protein (TIGR00730 family)